MPGFTVVERTEMISPHPIGEIAFKGCRVPAEDMVGAEGDGFILAMRTLDTFRASVEPPLAAWPGARLMNLFAMPQPKTFGQLLAEHQLIQEKLADMITELDAARLLVIAPPISRHQDRTGKS